MKRSSSGRNGVGMGRPEMIPIRSCPWLMRCCTAIRAPEMSSIPTDQQPSRTVSMSATGTSLSKISETPSVSVDSEMTRNPSTRRRSLRCGGTRWASLGSPMLERSRSRSEACSTLSMPLSTRAKYQRAM